MTLIINIGKWGGIYWYRGFGWRLCLGYVAFTILPADIDELFEDWYLTSA